MFSKEAFLAELRAAADRGATVHLGTVLPGLFPNLSFSSIREETRYLHWQVQAGTWFGGIWKTPSARRAEKGIAELDALLLELRNAEHAAGLAHKRFEVLQPFVYVKVGREFVEQLEANWDALEALDAEVGAVHAGVR